MQINVQKYLDAAASDTVRHLEQTVQPDAVTTAAGMTAALQPLANAVVTAISNDELIRATLTIATQTPTQVSFETGIINMPLVNAKKAGNFFEVEEIVPVNVYLVTENTFLNASGLRIDLVADSDTFTGATGQLVQNTAAHVLEQVAHITEEAAKPAPEPEEKPAAKKTATKRTTKKPAAKKTPAKKTTAKKATTKKATTTRKKKVAD